MVATKDVTAKTVVGQTETFAARRGVKFTVFLWCGVKVRREGVAALQPSANRLTGAHALGTRASGMPNVDNDTKQIVVPQISDNNTVRRQIGFKSV